MDDAEDGVGREEGLGDGHAAVGRIVEGTLQPLRRRRLRRVGGHRHQPAGEGGDPLRAHRIRLVGHGRGTDLVIGQGLAQLLEAGQQTDVGGELGRRLGNARERVEDEGVDLPRIGLPGHRIRGLKPQLLCNQPIELAHLGVVAVEELEIGGLGPGRALGAAQLETLALEAQALEVEEEVLHPQTRPLADRCWLRRLEVGHTEGRLVGPSLGELGQRGHHRQETFDHEVEGVTGDEELGIVTDEGRGRAQVEDRLRSRRSVGKGLEVGHDVVASAFLVRLHPLEIILGHLEVSPHLLDGLGRNLEPQLTLGLGQRQPHPPPRRVTMPSGKQPLHFLRRITPGQRMIETIERGHLSSS